MQTDHNYLQSVRNGINILKLYSQEQSELRVTEMAHRLEMTVSTVSRLVRELVQENFLERCPDSSRYRLGITFLTLSGVVASNLELHRESLPILKSLVAGLSETVHIAMLEGSDIVYLHKVECKHPVRLQSSIGKRNPSSCTSSGKVLLAFGPDETVETVITKGLPAVGPASVTDQAKFRKQLRQVRQDGFSVCIEELHKGDVSIAAPIRDYSGQVIAAVSVVGPKMRMPDDRIPVFVKETVRAGKEISERLGYQLKS